MQPAFAGDFRGVDAGVVDGVNVTHLSYMVYKLIKTNAVASLVDMPCRTTVGWMPAVVQRLQFELATGFKYFCVDADQRSHGDLQRAYAHADGVEFLHFTPAEEGKMPTADMVFSYRGLQRWGVKNSWAFFKTVRESAPRLVLFTNSPGLENLSQTPNVLNVRKAPFHFGLSKRVISSLTAAGADPLQLLLYDANLGRRWAGVPADGADTAASSSPSPTPTPSAGLPEER